MLPDVSRKAIGTALSLAGLLVTSGSKAVHAPVDPPAQSPSVVGTVGTAFNAAADAFLGGSNPSHPTSALTIFSQLIGQMKTCFLGSYPVIAIDEADGLKSWSTFFPQDLKALLGFFVAITTQERSAHVIMVSSDPSFLTWLSNNGEWLMESLGKAYI